jgi:hypothetical protein
MAFLPCTPWIRVEPMSWAELFKRRSWSMVWILIRRAPRDRRARVPLLRFLLACLLFLGYVTYIGLLARRFLFDLFGLIFVGALLGGALFFFAARKWTERYDLIQLQKSTPPPVTPDVGETVFRETCLLAGMLQRVGSERAMESGVEPGVEVITRRIVLERLRKDELLEGLEAPLLDLLFAVDGVWNEQQKRVVQSCWEFLAVLRWILSIDPALSPIWLSPEYHLRMASSLFDRSITANVQVLPPWEIRTERDRASSFFARCHVELAARDAWPNASPELKKQAQLIKADIDSGALDEELLLGAKTISELEIEELWNCTLRSYRRREILELMVEISGGGQPASALHAFLLEHLTAAPASALVEP